MFCSGVRGGNTGHPKVVAIPDTFMKIRSAPSLVIVITHKLGEMILDKFIQIFEFCDKHIKGATIT